MRAVRSFKRQSRNTYLRKSKLNDLSSYCRDIIFKKKNTARIGKKKERKKEKKFLARIFLLARFAYCRLVEIVNRSSLLSNIGNSICRSR